jgi:cytoskeletal protein CcmA (bactofilin family)
LRYYGKQRQSSNSENLGESGEFGYLRANNFLDIPGYRELLADGAMAGCALPLNTKGSRSMWKPASTTNTNPSPNPKPAMEPEKPVMNTTPNLPSEPTPVAAPRNAVLNNQEQATIGKSLVIKGEVTGSESLYIDGRVEGAINLPGNRVTVGRNGQVQANINAKEVVVLGKVKGNVTASDRVDIRNEGSLGGDVICQRISIEDGAWFKGSIDIRKPGQKEMNGAAKETSISDAPRMSTATA